MRLRLQNIGILSKADININGLTLITGENDSGKSTIGKVLYSIIRALNPSESSFNSSKENFTTKKIEELLNLFSRVKNTNENDSLIIQNVIDFTFRNFRTILHIEKDFTSIDEMLKKIDDSIKEHSNISLKFNVRKLINEIEERVSISLDSTQFINFELTEYLNLEFGNEIKNKFLTGKSFIEVKTNIENTTFNVDKDVKIDSMLLNFPYKDVIFIESPLFINDKKINYNYNSLRDKKNYLNLKLNQKNISKDIFSDNSQDINKFNKIIKEIIKGDFEFNDKSQLIYTKGGFNFSSSSIATGIKSFGLIKLLIESNNLNFDTLLIIDEPEVHLHPTWQVLYAEILVKISKEFAIPMILTSHSPYFIEAIEAYSKVNIYQDSTDFYFAKKDDDLLSAKIISINDNIMPTLDSISEAYYKIQSIRDEFWNS